MNLRSLKLQDLDTEGLAAVLLWILRRNCRQRPPAGYPPFRWDQIADWELAPVWLGKDVVDGFLRQGGATCSYGGDVIPELRRRVQGAVQLLRTNGLVEPDPERPDDAQSVVPTDEGRSIRIEIEDDGPWLALIRDARSIFEEFRSGILHLTGRMREGDERGATAFWTRRRFFVTCAHNLALLDWALHHADLKMTAEHLEARRHPDPNVDLAILVPKTTVISKLDMAALRIWDDEVGDGETVFILGYPGVSLREPSLALTETCVFHTRHPQTGIASLTFSSALPGGYSGGPLFNTRGCVVGIATEETFNQPGARGEPAVTFGHATPIGYLDEIDAH